MIVVDHSVEPVVSWRPGNRTVRHCDKRLGAEELTTGEQWFEKGTGAPVHYHPAPIEEVICIISGSMRFWYDGQEQVLEAGGSVLIAPDVRHGFVALEDLHIGGGALSSAVQTTVFDDEPDTIYDIGDTEGIVVDEHRRIRQT
ncbi:MAG: cupin domain-containing protein [Actinobacteria bacterium]|nr:cupin domain-containing protein [Actinomycetota bacterium]